MKNNTEQNGVTEIKKIYERYMPSWFTSDFFIDWLTFKMIPRDVFGTLNYNRLKMYTFVLLSKFVTN